ncbi:MAG: ABC transporter substrate-binding protein [Actinomycetota bacterium]|nr:ABC transporter substrate-binding protein [Actinomycetota bacterium]
MRLSRRTRLAGVALLAASSLTLAACGGGSDDGGSGSDIITTRSTEPQNPLVPTSTNETGGGNIITMVFAGLVSYAVDGTPKNEVAESIESDDNQNWTIKLKSDWKFSDGTPVKAKNFVDAWNYGAAVKNAQLSSYFFEPIKGYAEASAEGSKVETLSGLKVVDDTTFTVALNSPQSDFPLRLGYSAYVPLPDSAFKDMKAFGEDPVGNGPYKLAKKGAWEHNKQIALVPNKDYKGARVAKNDGLTFVFYKEVESAYSDLQAGNLDVLDTVPASALQTFTDATDIQPINKPGSVFQSITIPDRLKHFGLDEEGSLRRQAISMAIDRKAITDKIFFGSRTAATDFGSPVLPTYSKDLKGSDVLQYNPDKAKDLWKQADAISPWDGEFKIAYNADDIHKGWVDASTNQIKNTLGIKSSGAPYATFDEFRKVITDRSIKTAFRTGWQPDYPSLYNYLAPLYASGSADGKGSNDGDYKSKEFDGLLAKAASSKSDEERTTFLQQAEEVLFKDLPAIPTWYTNVSAAAAKGVKNVEFNWANVPEYQLITKK